MQMLKSSALLLALLSSSFCGEDPIIGKYKLAGIEGSSAGNYWLLEITGTEYNTTLVQSNKGQTDSAIEYHFLKKIARDVYSIEWLRTVEKVHSVGGSKMRILARSKLSYKNIWLSGDTLKVGYHNMMFGKSGRIHGEWITRYPYVSEDGKKVRPESTSMVFSNDRLRVVISSHRDTSIFSTKISNDTVIASDVNGKMTSKLKWKYLISKDTLHLSVISKPLDYIKVGK